MSGQSQFFDSLLSVANTASTRLPSKSLYSAALPRKLHFVKSRLDMCVSSYMGKMVYCRDLEEWTDVLAMFVSSLSQIGEFASDPLKAVPEHYSHHQSPSVFVGPVESASYHPSTAIPAPEVSELAEVMPAASDPASESDQHDDPSEKEQEAREPVKKKAKKMKPVKVATVKRGTKFSRSGHVLVSVGSESNSPVVTSADGPNGSITLYTPRTSAPSTCHVDKCNGPLMASSTTPLTHSCVTHGDHEKHCAFIGRNATGPCMRKAVSYVESGVSGLMYHVCASHRAITQNTSVALKEGTLLDGVPFVTLGLVRRGDEKKPMLLDMMFTPKYSPSIPTDRCCFRTGGKKEPFCHATGALKKINLWGRWVPFCAKHWMGAKEMRSKIASNELLIMPVAHPYNHRINRK